MINIPIHARILLSFVSVLASCAELAEKSEEAVSSVATPDILNHEPCDGIRITAVEFDNDPSDNSGSTYVLNGTAVLNNAVEREISLSGDLMESGSWELYVGKETQSSSENRLLELLSNRNFVARYFDDEIQQMSFDKDMSGVFEARDGDRYRFDYEVNDARNAESLGYEGSRVSCDDLQRSFLLEEQNFESDFSFETAAARFEGKLKVDPEEGALIISGVVEQTESSEILDVTWVFQIQSTMN
jgi:hypothetical protein